MIRRMLSSPSLRLTWFAAAALAAISLTAELTQKRISLNQADWEQRELLRVLENVQYDNRPHQIQLANMEDSNSQKAVYIARFEDQITALVWSIVAHKGYNGPIKLLVAIDRQGAILGLSVSAHQETAGLGDLIEADKSNWLQQFTGSTVKNRFTPRAEGGDFDALTRATITSRAVMRAVSEALTKQAVWQENANL